MKYVLSITHFCSSLCLVEAPLSPHGSTYPCHLGTSIMYQSEHVWFPKNLTFHAVLCRLFNPIPQGSETVHISKARRSRIFTVGTVLYYLTYRFYLSQIP